MSLIDTIARKCSGSRGALGGRARSCTQDLPVTHWLQRLRQGDTAAAKGLFRADFARLVHLDRALLISGVRRATDEEDVALSALDGFCRAAAGRFPNLHDRQDLWRLLLSMTLFKARDLTNSELRQKQGRGQVLAVADLFDVPDANLDQLTSPEPPPELETESCQPKGRGV